MKPCSRSSMGRLRSNPGRLFSSATVLILLLPLLTGCLGGITKSIDDAINEIDKTRQTIQSESTGWRDELPKLVNSLNGLESQTTGDVKGIVADTTNSVQDLATQTISFGDAKAQDLIAQAGVEFRCNADFVKAGVTSQLQWLADDLKFWKLNKRHLDKKPIHAVCWINPTTLSLYPSGPNWLIDTSNMSDKNIVHVFGYNFRPDAVPGLELQNGNGTKLRDANVSATYVTRYQLNLDFSNEKFPDVKPGMTVAFRWPDQADPNHINLTVIPPARLKISSPVFTPAAPIVQKDAVLLQVTVSNEGGSRSGSVVITWKPDPSDGKVFPITLAALDAGQSRTVSFPGYVYQHDGAISSEVSLSNGDDDLRAAVTVRSTTVALNYVMSFQVKGGGGGGGGPFTVSCPTNSVATGLAGRSGDHVDQVQLRCSQLLNNGTTGQSTLVGQQGGSGGSPYSLSCPPNLVLAGIMGRSGERVDAIQGHCASLTSSQTFDTGGAGGGGGGPFSSQCPASYVVTGIVGRSGEELDQINIVCTAIVKN